MKNLKELKPYPYKISLSGRLKLNKRICPFCREHKTKYLKIYRIFGKKCCKYYSCPKCGVFNYDYDINEFRKGSIWINRIKEKEEFERSYHSFVDVQAVQKLKKGIRYITKYLSKYTAQSQTLTLALYWLFRKRSFAVSGDFREILYTIIETKHQFVQTDLFRNKLRLKVEWIFIGIFTGSTLGINHNEWRKIINNKEILFDIM